MITNKKNLPCGPGGDWSIWHTAGGRILPAQEPGPCMFKMYLWVSVCQPQNKVWCYILMGEDAISEKSFTVTFKKSIFTTRRGKGPLPVPWDSCRLFMHITQSCKIRPHNTTLNYSINWEQCKNKARKELCRVPVLNVLRWIFLMGVSWKEQQPCNSWAGTVLSRNFNPSRCGKPSSKTSTPS